MAPLSIMCASSMAATTVALSTAASGYDRHIYFEGLDPPPPHAHSLRITRERLRGQHVGLSCPN